MEGNVITYKAKLISKGYRQGQGIYYDEIFCAIAMLKSIRMLIVVVARYDYEIWKMDMKTVFLNGKLSKDVYMT